MQAFLSRLILALAVVGGIVAIEPARAETGDPLDAFDASSCVGPPLTRAVLQQLVGADAAPAPLGDVALHLRQRDCAADGCGAWQATAGGLVAGAGPAGRVALGADLRAALSHGADGYELHLEVPSRQVLGSDGAYYEVSATVHCDEATLLGDLESPCAAAARYRKLGAAASVPAPLSLVNGATDASPRAPRLRIAMTASCFRLWSEPLDPATATLDAAALVWLPLFEFALPTLDQTMTRLTDEVYRSKAALFAQAADLLRRAPVADPPDWQASSTQTRLFIMGAMLPVLESVTSRFFIDRVMPGYQAAWLAARAAAGLDGLGAIPSSPSLRGAALTLLATALRILEESTTDAALRSRIDAVVGRAGEALARGAAAAETTAVFTALRPDQPALEALAAGDGTQGPALLCLTLLADFE
jgi:hypothetical protein